MKTERVKDVEATTLRIFQEEIPSIYFSDKSDADFSRWADNTLYTYRDLLKFPPRMFDGASLIDFGAGTGENTITLARWGANCTLVDVNDRALAIAREVFARYAKTGQHQFVLSSLFDYESPVQYDIVHSRGVLAHTGDKQGAFRRIAAFLKPGGFLIFGDPNKAGGFQNMLQRYAVYTLAKTWDEMAEVAEKLFKEDIDRSQSFVSRTRRSIIFDRWVIQSQDDPSVPEVMGWLKENGLKFYSAYPPFLLSLVGDSAHHQPKFDAAAAAGMSCVAETTWMLQRYGDTENVWEALGGRTAHYAQRFAELTKYVENLDARSTIDADRFSALADAADAAFIDLPLLRPLQARLTAFLEEAKAFVRIVQRSNPDEIRAYIVSCRHLFKGACGVRHVDFIAYKPEAAAG